MSSQNHTDEITRIGPEAGSAEVLKSDIMTMLGAQEVSLNGEFAWPIPPNALAMLYLASAEHCRAINIKAESAFGGGLMGPRAAELDALCDGGATELFVNLGIDLETYGNAFLQVIRSSDGKRIISLRRLPAITMSRYRNGYLQRAWSAEGREKKTTFTADEIVHLREPCPFGGKYARPTWIGTQAMMELAKAAIDFNTAFFTNSAMPEYAVIFKGSAPSKEQKKVIGDFFRAEFQGTHQQHRTLLLHVSEETTVEFERLTSEVKDGDFLKLMDAARDRMPTAHGVPSRMLGIMSGGQLGGGGEFANQLFGFEHMTLKPKRRRMLDLLRPVLTPLGLKRGEDADGLADNELAFRPLDLTPPKDDADNLPDLVNAGILDGDEARALLNLATTKSAAVSPAGAPITRQAPTPSEDRLVALLERL